MQKIEDLRSWLKTVEEMGELQRIDGAHWDVEIGTISEINTKRANSLALLFDKIADYPAGCRVLTGALMTTSRLGLTFGLGTNYSKRELVKAFLDKLPQWEAKCEDFPPEEVTTGPVMENVRRGEDVDLFEFPAPKWRSFDGGRYIGTGCAVITRDPESGWVNLGTYRMMIHDRATSGISLGWGHHGQIQCQKYHNMGKPCPVAVSLGHEPLIFAVSALEIPTGICEYNYAGAAKGERIKVIKSELTGLPIPANGEIVIEGWIPPGIEKDEGPYGEWHGYYGSGVQPRPVITVERVMFRNNPILLGAPVGKPPHDASLMKLVVRSAMLQAALIKDGIPEVKAVWTHEAGDSRLLRVVSIKQRYPGHARQTAYIASECQAGGPMGRYTIVVDEDIDPFNIEEVLWAVCTRSDPEKDIDIVRRSWGSHIDPIFPVPQTGFNSRAIIDACKPYEWINNFPKVAEALPDEIEAAQAKWRKLFK